MVFITGDTHGKIDIKKLNSKNFKEGNSLNKNDYLIESGILDNNIYRWES